MYICTIIPARSGSKSIKNKNIRLLNGKPLIKYSIEYSLSCKYVNRTIVSTDSKEYAKMAVSFGAEIPFIRPKKLAQDDSTDLEVLIHAIDKLENMNGQKIDIVILLYPTSPLRPRHLIKKGIELFNKFPTATSIRSVTVAREHPYRMWEKKGNFIEGFIKDSHEPFNKPRQKLPLLFWQTGDMNMIKRDTIVNGSVTGNHVLPLVIDAKYVVDIDEELDFIKATRMINN